MKAWVDRGHRPRASLAIMCLYTIFLSTVQGSPWCSCPLPKRGFLNFCLLPLTDIYFDNFFLTVHPHPLPWCPRPKISRQREWQSSTPGQRPRCTSAGTFDFKASNTFESAVTSLTSLISTLSEVSWSNFSKRRWPWHADGWLWLRSQWEDTMSTDFLAMLSKFIQPWKSDKWNGAFSE